MLKMEKNTNKFVICALGVFVSYFYFGILQEKVTKGIYSYESIDENGEKTMKQEKFTYVLALVFIQCIINYIVAYGMLHIGSQKEDKTSKIYYISISTTYLLAMVASNMALQWIPYPTQVVGKSAKPIPVMIFGVLLGRKSYTLRKYFFVLLIVIGMVLFMLKDKTSSKVDNGTTFGIGEILLILSLTMDGLTGAVQERVRAESSPSGHQMMKATNGYSSVLLLIALVVTGEALSFSSFAHRHPTIIYNLLTLGLTQAVGQLFLYVMVCENLCTYIHNNILMDLSQMRFFQNFYFMSKCI
ncbi:solute carrier family 35 member B1 homolog isoform X2 [Coccinella septempunctata]|uniref:solute carrier family 35 member B1 homolog isoform X2 n=1 Tax=Coccinella septempunctata TaxID=41139 RepID=UPI001D06521B|nr:solute carrier family 35 member B1 homolog isoform X2 [Coccinella septempunctata]